MHTLFCVFREFLPFVPYWWKMSLTSDDDDEDSLLALWQRCFFRVRGRWSFWRELRFVNRFILCLVVNRMIYFVSCVSSTGVRRIGRRSKMTGLLICAVSKEYVNMVNPTEVFSIPYYHVIILTRIFSRKRSSLLHTNLSTTANEKLF